MDDIARFPPPLPGLARFFVGTGGLQSPRGDLMSYVPPGLPLAIRDPQSSILVTNAFSLRTRCKLSALRGPGDVHPLLGLSKPG